MESRACTESHAIEAVIRVLDDTRKALESLAQELRAGEKLIPSQIFLSRHSRAGALLRAVQEALSEYDSGELSAPARRDATALSPRERSVLRLISTGLSNKCIARELQIAPETVKSHARSMLAKFNAKTRAEAVARAASMSLI